MLQSQWDDLIQRFGNGELDLEGVSQLNELLQSNEQFRHRFAEKMRHPSTATVSLTGPTSSTGLNSTKSPEDRNGTSSVPSAVQRAPKLVWLAMATLSVLLGLIFIAWNLTISRFPRAQRSSIEALNRGGFEYLPQGLGRGLPRQLGVWSGDPMEVLAIDQSQSIDGKNAIQFTNPAAEKTTQDSTPLSCDLYQFVDLDALRSLVPIDHEAFVELSASFLDARLREDVPIRVECQLFLLSADPASLPENWQEIQRATVAMSIGSIETSGGHPRDWRTPVALCALAQGTRLGLIRVGVMGKEGMETLDSQFMDRVELQLRTQPRLPVRQ